MQTSSLGAATPGIRDSCICFNTLQVAASPSQRHLQLQIPGPGLSRKTSLGAATVAQKKNKVMRFSLDLRAVKEGEQTGDREVDSSNLSPHCDN